MSFKSNILALGAVISRQENLYNLYLPDDKLMVSTPRQVVTKKFPKELTPASSNGAMSFVFTLSGGVGEE